MAILRNGGQVGVADKLAVCVIMPRREGTDLLAEADKVLGLAGEHDATVIQIAVEQRPDADGVPGGDEGIRLVVIDDHGKLRVQLGKHRKAVFPVQRQNDLAVAAALEFVALLRQLPLQGTEAVQFPVAHHHIAVQLKWLHTGLGQPHDGQPVEAQPARAGVHDPGHIRPPGEGPIEILPNLMLVQFLRGKSHNCAHKKHLRIQKAANDPKILGRIAAASVVPPNLLIQNQPLCGVPTNPCALTPHAASLLLGCRRSDRCSRVLFPPPRCTGLSPSPARCDRLATVLVSIHAFQYGRSVDPLRN